MPAAEQVADLGYHERGDQQRASVLFQYGYACYVVGLVVVGGCRQGRRRQSGSLVPVTAKLGAEDVLGAFGDPRRAGRGNGCGNEPAGSGVVSVDKGGESVVPGGGCGRGRRPLRHS